MSHFFKKLFVVMTLSLFIFLGIYQAANAQYQLGEFAGQAGYKTTGAPSLESIIQTAINAGLSLVGIIFLVLTLYAGIRWMTAQGNDEYVTKAKEILQAGVIGLVIVTMSYAITNVVFNNLPSTTPTAVTVDNSSVKLAGGENCSVASMCASGVCGSDGKCTNAPETCSQDNDCKNAGKCVSGVCMSATQSNACLTPCPSGQYCDPTGACKAGCAKDADCPDGKICTPGMNICEAPSGVGQSCGPNGAGKCYAQGTEDTNIYSTGFVASDPPCSSDPTSLIKCYIPKGMCASNADCDGGKGLCKANTCDNSPQAECEKDTANKWVANGLDKCILVSKYESCVSAKGLCVITKNQNFYQCTQNCDTVTEKNLYSLCGDPTQAGYDKCKTKNISTLNAANTKCNNLCTSDIGSAADIEKECNNDYISCIKN